MCYRRMGVGEGYDKVWSIKLLERKFSCWLAYIFNVGCYAVVTSCVKTSKGIISLPLQWYSRFLLLYFPDIYNVFFFLKCKPKTILIDHIHFPIKYRTNTNRSICLHLFSCSQRLLVERYTHSDRLITNHLWCHCSIVVKFFFLICVFDHDDWTFASFFFSLFMDLNFLSVNKKRERKNEANIRPSWSNKLCQ